MLIILEHVHGNIPDSTLLKMTQVTFKSIGEAVNAGDSILLRQVVDFFMDIYNQNEHRNTLKNYRDYYLEVERLLQVSERAEQQNIVSIKNIFLSALVCGQVK